MYNDHREHGRKHANGRKHWDIFIILVLMKKLNERTILDYENKLANVKENQKLDYFLDY